MQASFLNIEWDVNKCIETNYNYITTSLLLPCLMSLLTSYSITEPSNSLASAYV